MLMKERINVSHQDGTAGDGISSRGGSAGAFPP
jgi:hypothetical protein